MAITKVVPSMFAVANGQIVSGVTIGNTSSIASLTFDENGVIVAASNVTVTVANTNITGEIISSQIANSAITSEKIAVGAIPPSDDASALTTGTLPIERIADGTVTSAKLATGAAATNLGNYVTSVNGSTGAVTVNTTPPTTLNAIGTYAIVARPDGSPSNMAVGSTFAAGSAGSQLRIAGVADLGSGALGGTTGSSTAISGTWRLMSVSATNGGGNNPFLAVRIS